MSGCSLGQPGSTGPQTTSGAAYRKSHSNCLHTTRLQLPWQGATVATCAFSQCGNSAPTGQTHNPG